MIRLKILRPFKGSSSALRWSTTVPSDELSACSSAVLGRHLHHLADFSDLKGSIDTRILLHIDGHIGITTAQNA